MRPVTSCWGRRSLAGLAEAEDIVENRGVTFEIVGEIEHIETIATRTGVRVRVLLTKIYGRGRWRKRKGFATVRLANGTLRRLSYIGTRPTGSAGGTFKSRRTPTSHETLDAVCRLPGQRRNRGVADYWQNLRGRA